VSTDNGKALSQKKAVHEVKIKSDGNPSLLYLCDNKKEAALYATSQLCF